MRIKTLGIFIAFLFLTHFAVGALTYEVLYEDGGSYLDNHGGYCLVVADAAPGFSNYAETRLRFRPYGNEIEISSWVDIWEYIDEDAGISWGSDIVFSDITTGETMSFPNGVFSINPQHIYQIDMHAQIAIAQTEEFGNGVQNQLYFNIIPEPCTLLFLGLGGLLIRHRK